MEQNHIISLLPTPQLYLCGNIISFWWLLIGTLWYLFISLKISTSRTFYCILSIFYCHLKSIWLHCVQAIYIWRFIITFHHFPSHSYIWTISKFASLNAQWWWSNWTLVIYERFFKSYCTFVWLHLHIFQLHSFTYLRIVPQLIGSISVSVHVA